MKTIEQLKEELVGIESTFQSQVLGGNPENPPIYSETPFPAGGTNCVKQFTDTYSGGTCVGLDQGWVCDDQGPQY